MKRAFLIFLLLLTVFPAFALRSGQDAVELENIKWLRGSAQKLLFRAPRGSRREYRAAVFLLTNSGNAVETLRMLDQLAARYAEMVQICVITPDPESDAQNLLAKIHTPHLSFGVDTTRKTTRDYMAGSMLFPMAFLTDNTGSIAWNGECIDLPELLAQAKKQPVDTDKYEKISPLLDELQTLLRSNDSRRIRFLTSRIFKLDPGNAAALRMSLFVLENTGKVPEAWAVLKEQLTAVPDKPRLYYAALDMLARYPYLAGELSGVTRQFMQNIGDADSCDYLVWRLLASFNWNADALKAAVEIYEKSAALTRKTNRSASALAGHKAAGALLASKLGDFAKAVELQRQTVHHWQEAKNPAAAAEAGKIAEYLILCSKTRVKW